MDRYFFPLDSVTNWNRMYGRRGFVQYQATVPLESAQCLTELLRRSYQNGFFSFLGVLKRFGAGGIGMLSHPMPGYTLTLDFPVRDGLERFLRECDRLLLDWGGRLYLAKDILALPETIAAMYPRLNEFLKVRAHVDSARVLGSDLSRRLGWDDRNG
ncbi:MAG TPA: D-arabinono-1,4-lactone oxidase [Candidatus Hydrogenedentes bacterium]|nr:D-arabinono-1,4-lactone oxidase [Candidatus Hydrogenedentota bacterium]